MKAKNTNRMSHSQNRSRYWDSVCQRLTDGQLIDELLGEHKRNAHLALLARWADVANCKRILKTDLFEEALGSDHFLFDITTANGNVIGIDVSNEIVSRAKHRAKQYASGSGQYVCCDVKHLPFKSNSFDLIISNSTLDHFPNEIDIITAIQELKRVLMTGGTLIITMDNKGNIFNPLFRLRIWLGLSPIFIGKTYSITELKQRLEVAGFRVEETTAIIHQPRFINRAVRCLRQASGRRLDTVISQALRLCGRLERAKTKYLTGLYIAVKAVKCDID